MEQVCEHCGGTGVGMFGAECPGCDGWGMIVGAARFDDGLYDDDDNDPATWATCQTCGGYLWQEDDGNFICYACPMMLPLSPEAEAEQHAAFYQVAAEMLAEDQPDDDEEEARHAKDFPTVGNSII